MVAVAGLIQLVPLWLFITQDAWPQLFETGAHHIPMSMFTGWENPDQVTIPVRGAIPSGIPNHPTLRTVRPDWSDDRYVRFSAPIPGLWLETPRFDTNCSCETTGTVCPCEANDMDALSLRVVGLNGTTNETTHRTSANAVVIFHLRVGWHRLFSHGDGRKNTRRSWWLGMGYDAVKKPPWRCYSRQKVLSLHLGDIQIVEGASIGTYLCNTHSCPGVQAHH